MTKNSIPFDPAEQRHYKFKNTTTSGRIQCKKPNLSNVPRAALSEQQIRALKKMYYFGATYGQKLSKLSRVLIKSGQQCGKSTFVDAPYSPVKLLAYMKKLEHKIQWDVLVYGAWYSK
jgi:hypothetical protein